MIDFMATQHDSTRPKVTFQARFDADAFDKLTSCAEALRRSRSELVDFAVQKLVESKPEEISVQMLRTAKPKGKSK